MPTITTTSTGTIASTIASTNTINVLGINY